MKELLILSGKGGTGKTTIASAFIELGNIKAYADCDVDAPNLDILLNRDISPREDDFLGMDKAYIDKDKCSQCGICKEHCAFSAIEEDEGGYFINKYSCEGCSLCERLCPEKAIKMVDNVSGKLKLFKDKDVFSTATLKIGEGNSGLLVTEVKDRLRKNIQDQDKVEISIIDGSPGIGCPVIASINDADMVLIVAEPTLSGLSDLKRIVETSNNFGKKMAICINKYDINKEISKKICDFALSKGIEVVGKIPYDKEIINNLNKGKTAVEGNSAGIKEIREVYKQTIDILLN